MRMTVDGDNVVVALSVPEADYLAWLMRFCSGGPGIDEGFVARVQHRIEGCLVEIGCLKDDEPNDDD